MCRRIEEREMKILAINGSPKGNRSNTWRLTIAFLEGITIQEENGGAQAPEIETLNISSLNLKPCLGCFSCWSKTPGECCIRDDMQGVINKILWADVVVWSFPLYYFGLPGQLKTLIDRQLPMSPPVHVHGNGKRRASFSLRYERQEHRGYFHVRLLHCPRELRLRYQPVRPTVRKRRLHCDFLWTR